MIIMDIELDAIGTSEAASVDGYAAAEDMRVLEVAAGGLVGYGLGMLITHYTGIDEKIAYLTDAELQTVDYSIEVGFAGVGAIGGWFYDC